MPWPQRCYGIAQRFAQIQMLLCLHSNEMSHQMEGDVRNDEVCTEVSNQFMRL